MECLRCRGIAHADRCENRAQPRPLASQPTGEHAQELGTQYSCSKTQGQDGVGAITGDTSLAELAELFEVVRTRS